MTQIESTAASLPDSGDRSPCMAKLHKLGWSVGFTAVLHGARIGVRSNDPALLEQLRERMPTGARFLAENGKVDLLFSARLAPPAQRAGLKSFHLLYMGIGRIARTTEMVELFAAFDQVCELVFATYARGCALIHAGVVGWRGKAIVLPGRSHSGKTSLVAALLAAGADYLSDEFAVLTPGGKVRAYPRRLSIRSRTGGAPRIVGATELGAKTETKALPVGLIASLTYQRKKLGRGRLKALSAGEASMELLANSAAIRVRPALVLGCVTRASEGGIAVKGKRGEAAVMAQELIRRLAKA